MKPIQDEAFRIRTQTDYAVIKQATRRLVKACGGLESAATITRVGHSELARYYDPAEKLFMPIDIAADLETDCGKPMLTRALASLAGCELVGLPQSPDKSEDLHHWSSLLANLGQETASTLAHVATTLAKHGTLTAQAITDQRLTSHLDALIASAMQLRSTITRRQNANQVSRLPRPEIAVSNR